ncbi:hypothetical protein [Arthrobacter sp. B3I4]|uniref:hypothetical protein n=1 Tax=Arthrobacter sp. B3I4 TaxID=3042267 RepID=UPI002789A408|nr:hypothetical protein [Arthrobacter sp. B3I4]MDQ0755271.1 hypothetical protein [Arthrobacter sp. B3I4]
MSNPPVEPSDPDGPESGKQAPQYGENTPQYGQNAPQYGQQSPGYGQNAPQYGQQSPGYGQNAPQYGQQSPGYGQNAPQYGQQSPGYGQNAPQYGQQSPVYGQNQYGQQPPVYGQNQYGQGPSPYAQYPSGQPEASSGMPKLLNTAFWLLVASGAVWIVSLLLAIGTVDTPAMRDMVEQQMTASGASISFEDIKGAIIGSIIAFAVISAGLYALVALNVRKGKNWARILGTVFAVLSIFSLFPFSLGTLAVLLGIAGIVITYLPTVAPYFRKQPFANPYAQNPYGR